MMREFDQLTLLNLFFSNKKMSPILPACIDSTRYCDLISTKRNLNH